MNKRLIPALIVCAALATAQSRPPKQDGTPNNSLRFYGEGPSGTSDMVYECLTDHFGAPVPIPGVPMTWQDSYTTTASGWHSHEVTGDPRPQIQLLSAAVAPTQSNGCAYWNVTFPDIAGYYTVELLSPPSVVYGGETFYLVPQGGFNVYLSAAPKLNLAEFSPYQPPSGTNVFPLNYVDKWHLENQFFGTPTVNLALLYASQSYINLTSSEGAVDYLQPMRISLPDGGIADNATFAGPYMVVPSFKPEFFVPPNATNENHSLGVEIDIANPTSYGKSTDYTAAAIFAFSGQGCYLGRPPQLTVREHLDAWIALPYLHFNCVGAKPVSPTVH